MPFTLVVLKTRQDYGNQSFNNSLAVSAKMIVDMLQHQGHPAGLAEAKNENFVQGLVDEFKATTVVIEAIWITPAKMHDLQEKNKGVRWVVRINSEVPFLAAEGNSIDWIHHYLRLGVTVAFNSESALRDFQVFAKVEPGKMVWLPNYYPPQKVLPPGGHSTHIKIGCFGAIRQLKNQLLQAFAAVKYGALQGRPISFYMNQGKVEPGNEGIIPAVRSVLALTGNELILNPWLGHEDFIKLIRSMDIGMQVSFTESFSMVSADFVSVGVPLIGSKAVRWLPPISQVDAGATDSIVDGLIRTGTNMIAQNHQSLARYTATSISVWNEFLGWA